MNENFALQGVISPKAREYRGKRASTRPRTSADGVLLLAFLALILLGPYLPLLRLASIVGIAVDPAQQGARLDNLAVPLFTAYVIARAATGRGLSLPIHTIWYVAFLGWLGLMTVVWWTQLPADYAGSSARGVGLLRSAEAYVRPLMILIIAANMRVSGHDLMILLRLILGVAVLMTLVAAAQLLPATAATVNPFLATYYANSPDDILFWRALDGGRVSAFMPQLSTLGMYMVLAVGLVGIKIVNSRSISGTLALTVILGLVLFGGALSGSKVFVGGTVLLLVFGLLSARAIPTISMSRLVTAVLVAAALWASLSVIFPDSADRAVGRVIPAEGNLYGQYLSSRFDPEQGKVFRTGAADIARDYPLTGLGLNVVHRTTDSMLLGIVIMGGIVGIMLYGMVIISVITGLWRVVTSECPEEVKSIARTMILLTVVFTIIAGAFHTLIQDRAGDAYWILVGLLIGPVTRHYLSMPTTSADINEPRSVRSNPTKP